MRGYLLLLTLGLLVQVAAVAQAQQGASSSQGRVASDQGTAAAAPSVDYEFFKTRVQPIFLVRRPGHARCYSCHALGAGEGNAPNAMRLQLLSPGSTTWNEEQSRKNFEAVLPKVVPGNPLASRLLVHPLRFEAGGEVWHGGGAQFISANDPEWQIIAAWVRGEKAGAASSLSGSSEHFSPASPATATAQGLKVRIIQTNGAGDNIHIIDPVTNRVVGEITGIDVNHGVAAAPDGSRLYVTNESERTVDVVDAKTLKVTKQIPLSGGPNNIAISQDGRRVYAAIHTAPGGLDVIDTATLTNTKRIPLGGMVIHNPFVTPDGKYVIAASDDAKTMTAAVIDQKTEEQVRSIQFDGRPRPLAFSTNSDGSTKWLVAGLSGLHGFVVVDFADRQGNPQDQVP